MIAFLIGVVVGLTVGMTGGGGSIIAVPMLVYLLGYGYRQAVSISLAVVGIVSLYGALLQSRRGQVVWVAGVAVGMGGGATASIGTWLGSFVSERTSLLLFAGLMVVVASRLLIGRKGGGSDRRPWYRCPNLVGEDAQASLLCIAKLAVAGGFTGILAGFFGVGGGFLIVPTLLAVGGLPISSAVGTSLVSITLVALSGTLSHCSVLSSINWWVTGIFLTGAITGMTGGSAVRGLLSPKHLQNTFACFLLAVAMFVVFRAW